MSEYRPASHFVTDESGSRRSIAGPVQRNVVGDNAGVLAEVAARHVELVQRLHVVLYRSRSSGWVKGLLRCKEGIGKRSSANSGL
jgi:hypothetical protein